MLKKAVNITYSIKNDTLTYDDVRLIGGKKLDVNPELRKLILFLLPIKLKKSKNPYLISFKRNGKDKHYDRCYSVRIIK